MVLDPATGKAEMQDLAAVAQLEEAVVPEEVMEVAAVAVPVGAVRETIFRVAVAVARDV